MNRLDAGRAGRTVSLGDALRRAVADLGIGARLKAARAVLLWPEVAREVVGEALAAKTRAIGLKGGELSVAVAQDALRHRLLFERERILDRINQRVGQEVVTSLRFGR